MMHLFLRVCAVQDHIPLTIQQLALFIVDRIEIHQRLPKSEVVIFDLLLRIRHQLRQSRMLNRHVFISAQRPQHPDHRIRTKNAHHIIIQ